MSTKLKHPTKYHKNFCVLLVLILFGTSLLASTHLDDATNNIISPHYDNLKQSELNYSTASCEEEAEMYSKYMSAVKTYAIAMVADVEECNRVSTCDGDGSQNTIALSVCDNVNLPLGATGNGGMKVGVVSSGWNIPTGAIITNAYIQFTAESNSIKSASFTVFGDGADNSAVISTADDIYSRSLTSQSVSWSPATWMQGDNGLAQRTPDLSAIVQEIIDRPGYVQGNNIGFVIGGKGRRSAVAYEDDATAAPEVCITYTLPEEPSSTCDGCPSINVISLDGVPNFPSIDLLNVCSSPDTAAILVYNSGECNITDININMVFDEGLSYGGFVMQDPNSTSTAVISEGDLSDLTSPVFNITQVDSSQAYIFFVGIQADCDVDIESEEDLNFDVGVTFSYNDADGSTPLCEEEITEVGAYNSGVKIPVINAFSISPAELNLTMSGESKCQRIRMSQDGIDAFLDEFYFTIDGLDQSVYSVTSIDVNDIPVPSSDYSYDPVTQKLSLLVTGNYFVGSTSYNNSDGDMLFETDERVFVDVCYEVMGCTEDPNFLNYSAFYGCNDKVCFDVSTIEGAVNFKPDFQANAVAVSNYITYGAICGTDLEYEVALSSTNTDSLNGLWQDLIFKYTACLGNGMSISNLLVNGVALDTSLYSIDGSTVIIDFTNNTDPAYGLTDEDGTSFMNDLPGGEEVVITTSVDISCSDSAASCDGDLACNLTAIEINGKRNCGQDFQQFANLVTPITFFYGEISSSDNTVVTPGYGLPITERVETTADVWIPGVEGYEYGYEFGYNNITPCASPGGVKMVVSVISAGERIKHIRYEDGSATYQGSAVSGVTSAYETVLLSDGVTLDTVGLTIEIPAGDVNATLHDYYFNLEYEGFCAPGDYVYLTYKVVEECNGCGGTDPCEIVRSCGNANSYVVWRGSGCQCLIEADIDEFYRTNYGFADKAMTIPLTKEDVPAVDRQRFIPGDTMYIRSAYIIKDIESLKNSDYLWYLRILSNYVGDASELIFDINHAQFLGWFWKDATDGTEVEIGVPDCFQNYDDATRDNYYYPSMRLQNFGVEEYGTPYNPNSSGIGGAVNAYGACDNENVNPNYPVESAVNYDIGDISSSDYNADEMRMAIYWGRPENCAQTGGSAKDGLSEDHVNPCFEDFFVQFPMDDFDTIFLEVKVPLIHNPAYDLDQLNGTNLPQVSNLYPYFNGYTIDEATCGTVSIMGSCSQTTPYESHLPGPVSIANDVEVTDCDTEVNYTFSLQNPVPTDLAMGELPWYENEYRPYMATEYLEFQFPNNMVYLNEGVIIMPDGSEVTIPTQYIDTDEGNLNCVNDGSGGVCCVAADSSQLASLRVVDEQYRLGQTLSYSYGPDGPNESGEYCDIPALKHVPNDPYPHLAVGGQEACTYGIRYNLSSLCPEDISSSDFNLEYQFAEPYIPSLMYKLRGSYYGSISYSGGIPYTRSYYWLFPNNPYGENCGAAADEGCIYYFQKINTDPDVSNGAVNPMRQTGSQGSSPDNFTDNSLDFPPLIPDIQNLLKADAAGMSEFNTYTVCAGNVGGGATHTNVVTSIEVPNSVQFINAADENDNPLTWSLAETTPTSKIYAITNSDLAPGECDTVVIETELLFCPIGLSIDTDVCVSTISGCLDPEKAAVLSAVGAACDQVSICYKYIAEEAGLQVEFDPNPSGEYGLCDTIPFGVRIKNVKPSILTEIENDFWFPSGLKFVPGSWQVCYPGGPSNTGACVSIADPTMDASQDNIYGVNYGYDEDADWSSYIDQNGLPGILTTLGSDSNKVQFLFDVTTECDDFVSGSSVYYQANGADPCEARVKSMFIESNRIIIENANPDDFAQFFVYADPTEANCGEDATLELTYLNISPFGESKESMVCIDLETATFNYMSGSITWVSPASHNPTITEEMNGSITHVCFDIPDGIGPGEAFKISMDYSIPEDIGCGPQDLGVQVTSEIMDQSCSALDIECSVQVLNSVNPQIQVDFLPPLNVDNQNLMTKCPNPDGTVDLCYTVELANPGAFYNGDVTIALIRDVNMNGLIDDEIIDTKLAEEDHFVLLNTGETSVLTGCFTVYQSEACPVFLMVMQTTECVCNSLDYYYDSIEPAVIGNLGDAYTLCPGVPFGIESCGSWTYSANPSAGATIDQTSNPDSVFITLNSGYGQTSPVVFTISSQTGACQSFDFPLELYSLADFEFGPYEEVEVCDVGCKQLSLEIPEDYENSVVVEWLPNQYLDDNTSLTPIICNPQSDVNYFVKLTFTTDGASCEYTANYPVVVLEQPTQELFDDGNLCNPEQATYTAPSGYSNYNWIRENADGTTTVVQSSSSSEYEVLAEGTYYVEFSNLGDVCTTRSNSFRVTNCPELTKTITTIIPTSNPNEYTVSYDIVVTSTSALISTYDVYDEPGFDEDITILSANYSSDVGASGGLALPAPASPGWLLGDDISLPANAVHTYTVSYVVNIDLEDGAATGDDVYTACGQGSGPENASPGEALYNNATLDLDDDTTTSEVEDSDCGELPYLTLEKEIISTVNTGTNCYDVTYKISVTNTGGATGEYDLIDDPAFDDDIEITNAEYTTDAVGNTGGNLPISFNVFSLADDQEIAAGKVDSFALTVGVCLDLEDENSVGDEVYTSSCGDTNGPTDPTDGEGLYNEARLDVNNDGTPDQEAEACDDVPYLVLDKSFDNIVTNADGTYDVVYNITVENIGGAEGEYDLMDLPSFDDDFVINSGNYTSDVPSMGTLSATPPATGWVLGDDVVIADGITHTYTVTVNVSLDIHDPATPGDGELSDCGSTTPGMPTEGEGLFNEALLDTNNDGTPDIEDSACPDLEIFDLALVKQLSSTTPGPFAPGDDVTFSIEVVNQGTEDAYNVEVVDYIPTGLTLDDTDWTESAGVATTVNPIVLIPAGDSYILTIDFTIDADFMESSIINVAEISNADDDTDPNNTPPTDVDSTPDTTDGNDAGGEVGTDSDDSVDGDGSGAPGDEDAATDEDDSDPALIEIVQTFDLALTKVINTTETPGPFVPGDDVTFTIEVINQGTLDAFNVEVVDYIPTGLSLSDTDWTEAAGVATINTVIATIPAGESTTVDITFTIDADFMESSIINVAEISSADDDTDPTNTPPTDVDSTPDTTDGNDAGGEVGTDSDDSVDGDGSGAPGDEDAATDEDDSDPALVEIEQTFDLALTKVINTTATPGPYMQGSTVTFTINVFNQGTLDAFNVEVVDYIPTGLTLDDALWTESAGVATINTPIASVPAGTTASVDITFTIDADFMGDSIENTAEISSADDDTDPTNTPPTDVDSDPDTNPDDDDFGGDNIIDNTNGDEDDSDPATVPIGQMFDLALTKTLSELTPGPFSPGSTVTFDINVVNQGSLDAYNVEVVDYIPEGLSLIDPNWSIIAPDVAEINNPIGFIGMGETVTVTISLTIDMDFMGTSIENFAEISNADDDTNPNNTPPTDFDSTPDTDDTNDTVGGDDVLDGTGGDEDDHDPEEIEVIQNFDLALTKKPLSMGPFDYGDIVSYEIEVYNQGTLDAYNIDVVDVLPCGLEYVSANDPLWSYDSATSIASTTLAGPLIPGESETIEIYSMVVPCSDAGAYVNFAEISGAENVNGDDVEDIDGTFDDDPTNDGGGNPDTDSDDVVDGDGTGAPGDEDPATDEDNQDPAVVSVFDLALAKTTTDEGPFDEGDVITFDIEITNQGNIDAYDVEIVDVIPCGFTYDATNNPNWTFDAGANVATTTIAGPIVASGGTQTVSIDLILTPCVGVDSYTNISEISSAYDEDGNEMPDADGTFDDNPNNDGGGNPDTGSDDVIDGDGTGAPGDEDPTTDEDNQDPELVKVADLAIDKQLASNGPFGFGDPVTFDIVVSNQGNVDSYNVGVIDYLPMGFGYLVSNDPVWSYDGTNATTTIPFIAAGESVTVPITLEIVMANGGDDVFVNVVEITGSEDEDGDPQDDIDSDPDTDPDNDPEGEDDIDPEGIHIFDLALNKTTMDEGPFSYGDEVTFTIKVFNQGSLAANDIDVIDYIPCGFNYLPSNEGIWTYNSITGNASTTIESLLAPGDSTSVDITLEVVRCTGDIEAYTNIAEISGADDYETGLPGNDNDSTPDFDPDNDGEPVDNAVNDPNDEDDHDPELIEIFDVALAKTIVTPGPYAYGDLLTFEMEVTNQGNTTVYDVEVSDYIPAGYEFSALLNGDWVEADGIATTIIPQIDPLTSETVSIVLELVMTSGDTHDWYNEAEVSSMNNEDGESVPDIDSELDNDPDNDNDVEIDGEDDDVIDEDAVSNPDDDEDDNDPAGIDVFDLALTKVPATAGPYSYGQFVDFTIEVFNQGNIIADNIEVTDYIPCGYIYAPANDGLWSYDAATGNATTLIEETLDPGASTTVTLTLQVQPCDDATEAWINISEISSATDDEGTEQEDIDGDFDDDSENDPGGNPETDSDDVVDGDGTGNPGDEDADTDEDNADPAVIEVFDLALFKTLDTEGPFKYGDILDFSITVINQGNVDAVNVEVTDYLPAGFDFDPAANSDWTMTAEGYLVYTVPFLEIESEVVLPLTLTLTGNGSGQDDYNNLAEISSADDDDDPNNDNPTDADSDPDSDPDNDNDVEPGDENDNVVDENPDDPFGEGDDDEDDSDPAGPMFFDLAMSKTTTAEGPFSYGDELVFDMTVYNQGTMVATNVEITEHIPCGYIYAPANDGTWTYDEATGIATATITELIEPGENTILPITLIVQPCGEESAWINMAEISDATDEDGNPQEDIDSTPDTDPDNDGGGVPDGETDDEVDGDGTAAPGDDTGEGDEDDADPEKIEVFDLALIKTLVTEEPYAYGDDLEFGVTVFNQGNVDAVNVQVIDYVPAGYDFDPALNPDWTQNADGNLEYTVASLPAGEQIELPLILELTSNGNGTEDYTNVSEISGADDDDDPDNEAPTDADSDPDSDPDNDNDVEPGDDNDDVTDENPDDPFGEGDDDEDDSDPAGPIFYDLALTKTTEQEGPFTYGDAVTFTMTVYNQGFSDAANIELSEYIPCGYIYDSSNDAIWTYDSATGIATTTIVELLEAGTSTTVDILLTVQPCADEDGWTNISEVSGFTDEDGNPEEDIDSTPDTDPDNDGGGVPDGDTDDEIDGDGTAAPGDDTEEGDEDDADPAKIEIFDLALTKKIDNVGPYAEGDIAPFKIEIFNQGNVDAYSIEVTDYLNDGYSFDAGANPGWSQVGDLVVYTIEGPLAPQSSIELILNLTVIIPSNANVNSWYNEAEISSADNDTDPDNEAPTDTDSDPDNDPDNDNDLVDGPDDDLIFDEDDDNDNEINENPNDPFGLGDDDEDDNDAAGISVVGGLGDTVWKDLDGDGIQDDGEPGVADVIVTLTDCMGNILGTATTDADGFYFFDNLIPGDYQVQFDISNLPEGCAFTFINEGSDPALDSDVDLSGLAPCTTISGGEYDSTFDAGLLVLVNLGDYVWHDLDADGVQEPGEPGIGGVTVNLYSEDNELIETTTTDENGYYLFENLYPGNYFVEFIDPEGFDLTPSDQGGNDASDSDVTNLIVIPNGGSTTDIITLEAGMDDLTIDAGYYMCVPIGELVWYDVNTNNVADPIENGINGMKVTLYKLVNGSWEAYDFMYTGHKPGTPSDDGYFKFCAPPGTYHLKFKLPPTGLVLAQPNVGSNENVDSDVTNANGTGTTNSFTVLSGQTICDIGAGYYPMAEVGNFVWLDANQNGMQDSGEQPFEGVTVQAYNESSVMVAETVTNAEGQYRLDYLQQQEYYLKFTPPTGYGSTIANAGDDSMDSDVTHAYGANTTNMYEFTSGQVMMHVDAGMQVATVLPVEWLYVKAENRGEFNLVEWATASEINTDYFEIERRVNNETSFRSIAKVDAAGNSQVTEKYAYDDNEIGQSGVYYYRIKQVDSDGRVDYSDIVSVTLQKGNSSLNVYPNPAITNTMITITGLPTDVATVKVFSKDGKVVRSGLKLEEVTIGQYELRFDVSSLLPGVYTLQIDTDTEQWIEKLIVVR